MEQGQKMGLDQIQVTLFCQRKISKKVLPEFDPNQKKVT